MPQTPVLSALLKVGIMFLPAIPAYLWIWPAINGTGETIFQVLVYIYVLFGTIFIGRKYWKWHELGINRQGIWISLACALSFVIARGLIILGVSWKVSPDPVSPWGLAWDIFYLFFLVGLTEELLFRGLIYHALEEQKNTRWAIWGSAFGFMLWHIFGQGVLIGLATFVIGLVFALIRQRGGGIVGLIVLHGLWDLESTLLVAGDNTTILGQGLPQISSFPLIYLGTGLLVIPPLYLWLVYPRRHTEPSHTVVHR